MKANLIDQKRDENRQQTIILLLSMIALTLLLGWIIGGPGGVVLALFISVVLYVLHPYYASPQLLKTQGARHLDPQVYPELYRIVDKISERAGLIPSPELYWTPSKVMNAFVIGTEENAAIVLSDSLLRNLDLREFAGIIGHEIAHIHNKDLRVMSLANVTLNISSYLAAAGQIMLLLSLPAIFFTGAQVAVLPLLLLLFSPTVCALLQLALSRTREFEADKTGVQLAGDVHGLISALQKLEKYHDGLLNRFMIAPWRLRRSSLLQTHPPTKDRIHRLLSMIDSRDSLLQLHWPYRVLPEKVLYTGRIR